MRVRPAKLQLTTPVFIDEALKLNKFLRALSTKEIAQMMKMSEKIS